MSKAAGLTSRRRAPSHPRSRPGRGRPVRSDRRLRACFQPRIAQAGSRAGAGRVHSVQAASRRRRGPPRGRQFRIAFASVRRRGRRRTVDPSLIAMVDEVHVNTSLAGFEALLRQGVTPTASHFTRAGGSRAIWAGAVTANRRRSIDELVAATCCFIRVISTRYGSALPGRSHRRAAQRPLKSATRAGRRMRRLQGKLMRRLRSLVQ